MSLQRLQQMSDVEALARIIEAEAGQESLVGKAAVGAVIDNRRKSGRYGKGWKGVIAKPGQFSAINDVTGYANGQGANKLFWRAPREETLRLAKAIVSGRYDDPTGGSTHYFNPRHADPKWAKGKKFTPIGNHVFGNADAGAIRAGGGQDVAIGDSGGDYFKRRYQSAGETTSQEAPGGYFADRYQRESNTDGSAEIATSGASANIKPRNLVGAALSAVNPAAAGALSLVPFPEEIGEAADLMVQGAMAEFGDEATAIASAGAKRVITGVQGEDPERVTFEGEAAAQRDNLREIEEKSPTGAVIGKGAGAVIGGAGLVAGSARLARGMSPAVTTTGKVARAGGLGAGGAAVAGFGAGEGGARNRAIEAGVSAPLGAIGGIAGREIAIGVGRVLGPLVRRGQAFVNGRLTSEAERVLARAGIDPAQITDEMAQAFEERARQSGITQETANRAAADEFSIPLTRGQATGDFDEIAFEEAARSGARGTGAGRIAREAEVGQTSAIDQAIDDIVTGAGNSADESGALVTQGLRGARDKARSDVRAAYDEVPDGTSIAKDAIDELPGRVRSALEEVTLNPSAQAQGALNAVNKMVSETQREGVAGLDFKAVESLRQKINKISNRLAASDAQAAFEVAEVRKSLDEWIEESVARSLISGDDAALSAVKNARGKYSAFKRVFTAQGQVDDAGRMLQRLTDPQMNPEGITPQEVTRYMFGAAKAGAAPHTVRMASRIKAILGEESPEWAELRRGAWLHVVQGTRPSQKLGPQALSSNIIDFVRGNGKALANQLFSQDEMNKMLRLANVLRMTVPPKKATNPSGTGAAVARSIQDASNAVTTALGVATGNPAAGFGMRLAQGVVRSVGGARRASRNFNPSGGRSSGGPGGAVAGGMTAGQGSVFITGN